MEEVPRPTTKSRITVGRTQVRFGYSCSAAGECAAEAVFCYTAENKGLVARSHSLLDFLHYIHSYTVIHNIR
jgi:hypothetical protein